MGNFGKWLAEKKPELVNETTLDTAQAKSEKAYGRVGSSQFNSTTKLAEVIQAEIEQMIARRTNEDPRSVLAAIRLAYKNIVTKYKTTSAAAAPEAPVA